MKWGNHILEEFIVGPKNSLNVLADVIGDDMELLSEQAFDTARAGFEGFDYNKPFRIGWYIEQEDDPSGEA